VDKAKRTHIVDPIKAVKRKTRAGRWRRRGGKRVLDNASDSRESRLLKIDVVGVACQYALVACSGGGGLSLGLIVWLGKRAEKGDEESLNKARLDVGLEGIYVPTDEPTERLDRRGDDRPDVMVDVEMGVMQSRSIEDEGLEESVPLTSARA
jgi:hypothetical protein